jgi:hypothetical protein
VKTQKIKARQDDVLRFDVKIKVAGDVGTQSSLNEQLILSQSSVFGFSHGLANNGPCAVSNRQGLINIA